VTDRINEIEQGQEVAPVALLTKLNNAMRDIPLYASPDGYNEHHNYGYVSIAAMIAHVRPALIAHKLFLQAEVLAQSLSEDGIAQVTMRFTLYDTETGQKLESLWSGLGQDLARNGRRGDKGLYKALSGGLKYFLQQTFLIASGDDPESENDAGQNQQAQNRRKGNGRDRRSGRRVSDNGKRPDPMTAYWLLVKELGLSNGKEILQSVDGDATKAIAIIEQQNQEQ